MKEYESSLSGEDVALKNKTQQDEPKPDDADDERPVDRARKTFM